MTYSAWHYVNDAGIDGAETLDDAIAWGLQVVKNYPLDDEDNSVGVYKGTELDRIAVVYRDVVVVNDGHQTDKWPSGWTYLENSNA